CASVSTSKSNTSDGICTHDTVIECNHGKNKRTVQRRVFNRFYRKDRKPSFSGEFSSKLEASPSAGTRAIELCGQDRRSRIGCVLSRWGRIVSNKRYTWHLA